MNKKLFIIILAVLIFAGFILIYIRSNGLFRTNEAKAKVIADTVNIKSFAIGQISEVYVAQGDFVDAGQRILDVGTVLGRVGDNLTDNVIQDQSTNISTVYAPVKGYITNIVVTKGDSIELYAPLFDLVDPESYKIQAEFPREWISTSNDVNIGDEVTWAPSNSAASYEGIIDYIFPYTQEDNLKFNLTIKSRPEKLYIDENIKVYF